MKLLNLFLLALVVSQTHLAQPSSPTVIDLRTQAPGKILIIQNDYMEFVNKTKAPSKAYKFQNQVAAQNIEIPQGYDKVASLYTVIYKGYSAKVIANYNPDGKLVSTEETFKNVALPKSLQVQLFEKYPEWRQIKNTLKVGYLKDKCVGGKYIVAIKKGSKSKTLRFNLDEVSH